MTARKRTTTNKSSRKVARPRIRPDAPQDSDVFLVAALPSRRTGVVAPVTPVASDVFVVGTLPSNWNVSATTPPLDESDIMVLAPASFVYEDDDRTAEPPPDFVMQALDLDPEPIPAPPLTPPVRLPPSYAGTYQKLLNWTCVYGCVGLVTPSAPKGQHTPDCGYWAQHPKATPF